VGLDTIALRLVVGGDSKGAQKALSDLGGQSKKTQTDMGKALKVAQGAAAVGLTAIVGIATKGVMDYTQLASSIGDLQRQSKISATDASLLVGQWQRYGVTIEAGTTATVMLSKNIDAASGFYDKNAQAAAQAAAAGKDYISKTNPVLDAFYRLGISMAEIKKQSPAQTLEEVRSKLSQMPPGAERTAIAAKLLGKGFMGLSKWIGASSTDLDALNQQLKGTGQVMDNTELAKAKDDMKQMALLQVDLRGLSVEVGRSAMPIIRDLVPQFKKLLAVVRPLAPHLIQIGEALAAFLVVTKAAQGFAIMLTVLGKMKALLAGGQLASGLAGVAGAAGTGGAGFVTTAGGQTVAQTLIPGAVSGAGANAVTAGAGKGNAALTASRLGGAGVPIGTTIGAVLGGAIIAGLAGYLVANPIEGAIGNWASTPESRRKLQEMVQPGQVATGKVGGAGGAGNNTIAEDLAAEAAKSKASIDDAIDRLGAQSAVQTGAAFRSTMLQMRQLQDLAAKKIVLGNVDGSHTDAELRSTRDRIMGALHITVKQADRLMGQMFQDWRPQDQLVPKINRAAVAVENRIAILRRRAAQDLRMGNLDATQMLNEIGRISAALGNVRSASRTAGNAVANALKSPAGGGGSYRGHFAASGAYVRRTPGGTLLRVGEGRYDEVVAQVLPGRGQQQSTGGETHFHLHIGQLIGTDERAARQLWNTVKPIAMSEMRLKGAMSRG